MKKAVKSLIIAASVAAIAGIGAVSFAAWSANETASGTVTGSTTTVVTTIGDITVTQPTAKLKPYNQSSSNAVLQDTGAVTYWELTISNKSGDQDVTDTNVKYYLSFTETFNGGTTGKIYFSTKYSGTGNDINVSDSETQGWTQLTAVYSAGSETSGAELTNMTGKKFYIALAADGNDAQGQNVKLTVSAVQGAA